MGIYKKQSKKYTHHYFIAILMVLVYSCGNTSQNSIRKFSNAEQERFDNMLATNKEKSYGFGNKIQEREFNDSVKLAIGEYMDSTKLFINWEAQIQHIT